MSEQLAVQRSQEAVASASATLLSAEALSVFDAESYEQAGVHLVMLKSRLDAVEAVRVDTKSDALSLCKKIDVGGELLGLAGLPDACGIRERAV